MIAKKNEEVSPLKLYPGTKEQQLQALYSEWWGCEGCPLSDFRKMSKNCGPTEGHRKDLVFGIGNPDADIMIVGEGPGEEEEKTKVPFVGPSGRLLNQIIMAVHPDPANREVYRDYDKSSKSAKVSEAFHSKAFEVRNREFYITNAVCCRPPENRTPLPPEVKACWPRLLNMIYIVDPLVVVACGNSALSAVLRKNSKKITAERGKVLDVDYEGRVGTVTYTVVPTFHPSYLARQADYNVPGGTFRKTIEDWKQIYNLVEFLREKHYGYVDRRKK